MTKEAIEQAAHETWRYVIQQCGMGNDRIYDDEVAEVAAIITKHCTTAAPDAPVEPSLQARIETLAIRIGSSAPFCDCDSAFCECWKATAVQLITKHITDESERIRTAIIQRVREWAEEWSTACKQAMDDHSDGDTIRYSGKRDAANTLAEMIESVSLEEGRKDAEGL